MKTALVAVVLVAMAVTAVSLQQALTYEATAHVFVAPKQDQHGEETQPLPPPGEFQTIILEMTHAIYSRPVAEEAIQRLGLQMKPAELLDKLTVEQVEDTSFIRLSYEDTDRERAKLIANAVGNVSSELFSEK
jgi:capsular polysaccharide biosynthesis protein